VQTWDTEQEFLRHAIHHDVEGFLDAELARRERHRYPPFLRLVRLLISARDDAAADRWADAVTEGVRRLEAGLVLGPADLVRIADRQRRQVLVKTNHVAAVASAARRFLATTDAARRKADVRIMLDVDPQSLL
jgi:primosomal protein N' (replication factor Y)